MNVTQTSLSAYWGLTPVKLNERQKLVLEALEEIQPATNKQLASHLGWAINTVTPRCLELRNKGMVVEAYVGFDAGGRQASYWRPKFA